MLKIGLIKETNLKQDKRVALTPKQCSQIQSSFPTIKIIVESSKNRCYSDEEYLKEKIEVSTDMTNCHILMGIKEVNIENLIANKKYFFFSHTKKLQPYNQDLFKAMIKKKISLIDYECLQYADNSRILGFGFFAGIVGAHNGIMGYGIRTNQYHLERVFKHKDYKELIKSYFELKLPSLKIIVTGSGRVAKGIIEVMHLLDIKEVEENEFLNYSFDYPVFLHLRGSSLFIPKNSQHSFDRQEFHQFPERYKCRFKTFLPKVNIIINGIYWANNMPRLFEISDLKFAKNLTTIADITDDVNGSIPCNLGEASIANPFYGYNPKTNKKSLPFQKGEIDIMAVSNLPNELPRDASFYFGEQLIKSIIPNLIINYSPIIDNATILENGIIKPNFAYMKNYGKC